MKDEDEQVLLMALRNRSSAIGGKMALSDRKLAVVVSRGVTIVYVNLETSIAVRFG